MPTFRITSPDGKTYDVTGPEGSTAEQALAQVQASYKPTESGKLESFGAGLGKGFGQVVLGAQGLVGKGISALGGIGQETKLQDLIVPPEQNIVQRAGNWLQQDAAKGRESLENQLAPYKEANPFSAGAGELGGQLVATAPVGGLLGAGAKAAGLGRLGNALASGGMATGAPAATSLAGKAADLGIRSLGGAITGGASAGLVDPEQAGTGAVIGGALPGVLKAAGAAGNLIGRTIRGGEVAPEVAGLAARAKQLGIDIPADRLVNSKPLDAVASGLNYIPLSGRAATEAKMAEQLNTAASKLMGQNTPNINKALRAASADLGAKFDATLKGTGVAFDKQLLQEVTRVYNTAEKELGSDALKAISSQVDDLVEKGATGMIDGQAAYNIKRTLDRIGNRNGPEAFHALELKGVLMDALNRSLGPAKAAEFATTRQQYGNMLALEKLAKNGVEGEISVARLANLKNINNQPLQELADIAAQFVKPREGQHGAMQRAVVAGTAAMTGGPAGLAGLAAGGRGANILLNSDAARRAALGQSTNLLSANPELVQLGYKTAPVIGASR